MVISFNFNFLLVKTIQIDDRHEVMRVVIEIFRDVYHRTEHLAQAAVIVGKKDPNNLTGGSFTPETCSVI